MLARPNLTTASTGRALSSILVLAQACAPVMPSVRRFLISDKTGVMKSKHVPMSVEEFKMMPYPFGWKAEYWDNQAHLTPREYIVETKLDLEPRASTKSFNLMFADPSFKDQMVETFFETFQDSVEFCEWPADHFRSHAKKNINNYFDGERGQPLPVSVVVMCPSGNQITGLALFLENREGHAELDLLYVTPQYQGTGMATEMVTSAANKLYENGVRELRSAYHICNERSRAWQHKFGFEEIPDQFYSRLKYSWYRDEIWRREKLGMSEGIEELIREKGKWYAQLTDDWKY